MTLLVYILSLIAHYFGTIFGFIARWNRSRSFVPNSRVPIRLYILKRTMPGCLKFSSLSIYSRLYHGATLWTVLTWLLLQANLYFPDTEDGSQSVAGIYFLWLLPMYNTYFQQKSIQIDLLAVYRIIFHTQYIDCYSCKMQKKSWLSWTHETISKLEEISRFKINWSEVPLNRFLDVSHNEVKIWMTKCALIKCHFILTLAFNALQYRNYSPKYSTYLRYITASKISSVRNFHKIQWACVDCL